MCPRWLYERLPACYLLTAVGMIMLTDSPLLWLAGALLFVAGAASWMMRSSYRRTDLVIFPTKRWFQPKWLYEAQPFIWLALGLLLSHLPDAMALVALLPCAWACRWPGFTPETGSRPSAQGATPALTGCAHLR